MTVITMPAGASWEKRKWTPPARSQVNRSGWTGARTVVRLPGAALWRVSATHFPLTTALTAEPWEAFLAALEGPTNHFFMPIACNQVATNLRCGTVAQGAETAPMADMPASVTYMRAGQKLTFPLPSGGHQLVILTQPLVSNGSGTGTAHFRGAMREGVATGTTIECKNPFCEMAMIDDSQCGWDEDNGVFNLSFDAEEAFGIDG